MKYKEEINYDLSNGEAFIGKVLQATQNVVTLDLIDCEGVSQDTVIELHAGTDKYHLEPTKYFDAEEGEYKTTSLTILSGSSKGSLRIKDISQGEYFQLKVIGSGTGVLKTLKINY